METAQTRDTAETARSQGDAPGAETVCDDLVVPGTRIWRPVGVAFLALYCASLAFVIVLFTSSAGEIATAVGMTVPLVVVLLAGFRAIYRASEGVTYCVTLTASRCGKPGKRGG